MGWELSWEPSLLPAFQASWVTLGGPRLSQKCGRPHYFRYYHFFYNRQAYTLMWAVLGLPRWCPLLEPIIFPSPKHSCDSIPLFLIPLLNEMGFFACLDIGEWKKFGERILSLPYHWEALFLLTSSVFGRCRVVAWRASSFPSPSCLQQPPYNSGISRYKSSSKLCLLDVSQVPMLAS